MARELTLAWIAFGANLGDREHSFATALRALAGADVVHLRRGSRVYRTPPVGPGLQEDYWNAVLEVETGLPPRALLEHCLAIENCLGRARGERWGPRVLDLDLLLYGAEELEEEDLRIPHPRLHERAFVLRPLADLVPRRIVRGRTVEAWLGDLGEAPLPTVREDLLECL